MAFTSPQAKRSKKATFLSPNETHHYWKDRVATEILIKTRFMRAKAAEFRSHNAPVGHRTYRIYDSPMLRRGRTWKTRNEIFTEELPGLLTKPTIAIRKGSQERMSPDEMRTFTQQSLRLPRSSNGSQIPSPPKTDKRTYFQLFSPWTHWKPNQLPEDAVFAEITMPRSYTPNF